MNKYLEKIAASKFWDKVKGRISLKPAYKPSPHGYAMPEPMPSKATYSKDVVDKKLHKLRQGYSSPEPGAYKGHHPVDRIMNGKYSKNHMSDRLINMRVEGQTPYPGGVELGSLRAKVTRRKGPSFRTAIEGMATKRREGF